MTQQSGDWQKTREYGQRPQGSITGDHLKAAAAHREAAAAHFAVVASKGSKGAALAASEHANATTRATSGAQSFQHTSAIDHADRLHRGAAAQMKHGRDASAHDTLANGHERVAQAHEAAAKAGSAGGDQPRDDHGRWTK